MTFSASLRDKNIHCFYKCSTSSIRVKPSMIKPPINEKDSLSIQEVKSFLILLLFAILLMLNLLFNPYSAVPDAFIKTLA